MSETTFQKCKRIRQIIVNRAAEVMQYDWEVGFAIGRLRDLPKKIAENDPSLCQIQPSDLAIQECDELGFAEWSSGDKLRLIPLWLFPFLADEIKVSCINGSEVVHKSSMDNDNRYGMLAYGVYPKDSQ